MSSYRAVDHDMHPSHHSENPHRPGQWSSESDSSTSTRLDYHLEDHDTYRNPHFDTSLDTKYPPHDNFDHPLQSGIHQPVIYRPPAWKRIFWDTTPLDQRIRNHQHGVGIQDRAYVCWLLSVGMFVALIMEFVTNATVILRPLSLSLQQAKYQGTPITTKPTFNFMIGPSAEVLINTGARFTPCKTILFHSKTTRKVAAFILEKKSVPALSNIPFPCLNSTSHDDTCTQSLESICGFGGFSQPGQPDQKFRSALYLLICLMSLKIWLIRLTFISEQQIHIIHGNRFILPLFLHAGLIHYALNIAVQLTSSALIERQMGSLRFILLYLPSGIFGFILGGNFSLVGQPSVGASGAIFSTYAAVLVDLIAHWSIEYRPTRKLVFLVLEIVAGLLLGLIPGIDNFSHIGGFSMGILLAILLFPVLHQTITHRWTFYTVRVMALIGAILMFVLLYRNFFTEDPAASCNWCRYLSYVDFFCSTFFSQRCKGSGLKVTETTTTTPATHNGATPSQPTTTRTTTSAIMLPALLRLVVSLI
ncbi:hypothetical protein VP01_91g11 [Puccinia sorghi]|uniref:Rhomboid-type serine protease n=1 Tax=Puccinia sorghi TaxID=27349 RepID=A0A0L6U7C2_9BASI|nr:hypothetical protein VP01_91g11 [Puccinia sorghi]